MKTLITVLVIIGFWSWGLSSLISVLTVSGVEILGGRETSILIAKLLAVFGGLLLGVALTIFGIVGSLGDKKNEANE